MIKRAARTVLAPFLGKARFQGAWEALYELSLAGLNVGEGAHPDMSGERVVVELVRRRVAARTGRAVLFDVGANTGVYTRALLESFDGSAEIFAFEPSASAFRVLESNLGAVETVHLRRLALSDEEGEAILRSPSQVSKLGSLHDTGGRLERLGMSLAIEEPVELTTLDRFLAAEGVERVDLLKLDVEGHELRILEGARDALAASRIDAIQFEFSAANVESRTFFRDFYDLLTPRFALYRVLQDGLRPIERYREAHEIFKRATNYLALLRRGTA